MHCDLNMLVIVEAAGSMDQVEVGRIDYSQVLGRRWNIIVEHLRPPSPTVLAGRTHFQLPPWHCHPPHPVNCKRGGRTYMYIKLTFASHGLSPPTPQSLLTFLSGAAPSRIMTADETHHAFTIARQTRDIGRVRCMTPLGSATCTAQDPDLRHRHGHPLTDRLQLTIEQTRLISPQSSLFHRKPL